MVNLIRLKAAMVCAGLNQGAFAKRLRMAPNTLNAKVNGKSKITTEEATEMCEILGITEDREKVAIFLS